MNKIIPWVVTGGAVLVLAVWGGGYLLTKSQSPLVAKQTSNTSSLPKVGSSTSAALTGASSGSIDTTASSGFEKIFTLKAASSINSWNAQALHAEQDHGDDIVPMLSSGPCVVDGHLTYSRNTWNILSNTLNDIRFGVPVLISDGKQVIQDGKASSSCAFADLGALSYSLSNGDFVYGTTTYHNVLNPSQAIVLNSKLAVDSSSVGLMYDGKVVDSSIVIGSLKNIGDKLAYIRTPDWSSTDHAYWLMNDGKKYGKVSTSGILNYLNYNGVPTYISAERPGTDDEGRRFVISGDKIVSDKYYAIKDLGIVGGKLTFIGYKEASPKSVLVWGDKEIGAKYGDIMGYVDSAGVPVYVADQGRDYNKDISGTYTLVRGEEVIYQGKANENFGGRDLFTKDFLCNINGKPALVVSVGDSYQKDSTKYILYNGVKIFAGNKTLSCYNVHGKLGVLEGVIGADKTLDLNFYLETTSR